jgi:hypothetical protein
MRFSGCLLVNALPFSNRLAFPRLHKLESLGLRISPDAPCFAFFAKVGNHETWNPPRKTKFVRSTNPEGAVAFRPRNPAQLPGAPSLPRSMRLSIIGTNINHHTAPIGCPMHEQVSSGLPSRLVSYASAPEFGELPGKSSALGVTRLSGGPAPRQIHHFHATAKCVFRVAIREDGFDPAAACA